MKTTNPFYKMTILVTVFAAITIAWLFLYKDPCEQRSCDAVFSDDGFAYVEDFLPTYEFEQLAQRYVKESQYPMYPDNTMILGNGQKKNFKPEDKILLDQVQQKIETIVGQPLFVDYAFLRYYNGKAPNPFEFMHLDSKHYDSDTTQIRAVINLYDKSIEGEFCYESRCCNKGALYCNHTKPNTLTLIQANKLHHKYEYKGGERLIYVIDFTTSYKRGFYGSVWGSWDFVWDRIQKWITSF